MNSLIALMLVWNDARIVGMVLTYNTQAAMSHPV